MLLFVLVALEVALESMDHAHHRFHLFHHDPINRFCVRRIATLRERETERERQREMRTKQRERRAAS
jgi:hypothetical protein